MAAGISACAAAYGSSSAAKKQLMDATVAAVLCSRCSAALNRPVLESADSSGLLLMLPESVWKWWWLC